MEKVELWDWGNARKSIKETLACVTEPAFYLHTAGELLWIPKGVPIILRFFFRDFPQNLLENSGIIPYITSQSLSLRFQRIIH